MVLALRFDFVGGLIFGKEHERRFGPKTIQLLAGEVIFTEETGCYKNKPKQGA